MAVGNDGAITIKWTGTAGIEQAKNLQKNLLESFNGADKVLLDISELEDIDITGIQLVVSARKEAEKQKKSFYISGKIPEILEIIYKKNPFADVVVTAVSVETLNQSIEMFEKFGMTAETVQISAVRTHKAGSHTMFNAENPVFIIKGVKA